MAPRKHQQLLTAAIERDGEGQRELLAGNHGAARTAFHDAARLYQRSWEASPPRSYGRLVGMLKCSVLAGGGVERAEFTRRELGNADPKSPTASYAQALAALILGRYGEAQLWALCMSAGSEPFKRAADAIAALAAWDGMRYFMALGAIVRDFEERAEHLTGVAIADTAVVLERLAARRGLAVAIESPMLPPLEMPQGPVSAP